MNKFTPNHRLRFTLVFFVLIALAVFGSTIRQRIVNARVAPAVSTDKSDASTGESISEPAFLLADGTGMVTLTANGGACLTLSPGNVDQLNVVQGGSYNMTITGVTECDTDTITVFIQSSSTGNFCFNATETAPGSGTYTATFTMPDDACLTYPISYKCGADQPCSNAGTLNARGPSGASKVHLRASTFSNECATRADDEDCTSPTPSPSPSPSPSPQGCLISVPPGSDLGCNPVAIPVCDTTQVTGTGIVGEVQCKFADDTPPSTTLCEHSRTITYTATGADGTTCEATQTFTWKVDTTKPELHNLPEGGDLGCNPTPPSCDANVTATDECEASAPVVTCTAGQVTGGECSRSQTFTYSAKDGCGNEVSKDVTYTWKEDHTAPVLTIPADTTVECNAIPPVGNATANDNCDGAVAATYKGEAKTAGNCPNNYTLTRTWSAVDSCGNPTSLSQVIHVQDTTVPLISDPGPNGTIYCPNQPVFTPPTATDNCSVPTIAVVSDVTTQGSCGTYSRTVTWQATDACGLKSRTVSQTIVVECNNCGEGTIGFWQNKNGQALITSAGPASGTCSLTSYLRQYTPFQDLSATASCSAVATYVTNVVKSASAGGAAMNAMLKAQMLSTALDVYGPFGKINGGVNIDLTHINKPIGSASYENVGAAFGGASCKSINNMLLFQNGVSNVGGTSWYGQVKATQELAKDAFDAINNQKAYAVFSCP